MKKFFQLAVLTSCFIFILAATVVAQDAVRNNTACTFRVKVGHGPIGSCTATSFIVMDVPPFTQVNLGIPATDEIIIAKGAYLTGGSTLSCPFYIGLPCTIYPLTDAVTCFTLCGNYTATLIPGFGIYLTT